MKSYKEAFEQTMKKFRDRMSWSNEATEYEKNLVYGNLNSVEQISIRFFDQQLDELYEEIEKQRIPAWGGVDREKAHVNYVIDDILYMITKMRGSNDAQ